MADLVVIAYPTEATAEEVRQKLLAMQKDYLIELGDAVIAVKDPDSCIKLNLDGDTGVFELPESPQLGGDTRQ
jgi:uncharacterized membrane protein